jgi:nitrate/TMAO reductase-like tetraheme cytochrome c subunit
MNQLIVRRLGLALAGLIVGLLIPTYIIAQDIPPIPHKLENRSDCLACHEEGKLKSPKIPDDHAGRTNDICQDCHKPVTASAAPEEGGEATAGPPPIPHTLENRSDCLACHKEGKLGAPQIPADHEGRTSDMCQDCHKPVTQAAATPEGTAEPTGPAPIPHTLVGHENCLECHTSPEATPVSEEGGPPAIPHTLIGRENCLACHKEGIGGAPQIPEDHAGRPNDICQACHQPSQLPAAPTPTAPTEPLPTPVTYPRAKGVNTCLDCHLTLEDEKQVEITANWQRSIHAERDVTCADCHGGNPSDNTIDGAMSPEAGYIGVPAKADIPALCASCHADVTLMRQNGLPTDQWAQYQESTHGLRLAEGDPNVATCYDCHGGHQILKANDPASTVYASNVPAMCANCHGDKELMAPYNLSTNQYDLYRQSIHGHALLDNQDFRAPNCATCHGTHGAAPPGFEEVANICGSCHSATQDYYLKSPHTGDGELTPRCVTCHGHHEVSEPSEAIFLGADPRHCGECHASDSQPGQVAQSLYDTIAGAAQAYDEAEAAIQVAQGVGMIVSPMEAKLREANTNLITARAVQHTVDVDSVSQQTDSAQAIAGEVQASAEAAVAESIFRRRAMVIAVAAIALTIVALYLLKRELDRRLEADS